MSLANLLKNISRRLSRTLQKRRKRNPITRAFQKLARKARATNSLVKRVTTSYRAWLLHFDTPPRTLLEQWRAETGSRPAVRVVARFDKQSSHCATPLVEQLLRTEGQPWSAVFLFDDDCTPSENIALVQEASCHDPRIVFEPSLLATGADITIFIEGGALPRPHALRVFADCLRAESQAFLAYSDEDEIGDRGLPDNPWFKPTFSPMLAQQGVLLGRMVAIKDANPERRHDWMQLCQKSLDAQTYSISLALSGSTDSVFHVPHVLFSDVLGARPPRPLCLRPPVTWPTASVLIPTKDRWDLLGPCIESILSSDWPAGLLEIVVIDNGSTDEETIAALNRLQSTGQITLIKCHEAFNWARLNNIAATSARGDLLVFLNNDTQVIQPDWLKTLALHALQPGIGAVGCKLLFGDGTVQHGGVIAGLQGVTGHAHLHLKSDEGGYRGLANLTREVSAVTGACLAIHRDNFNLIGGFDESFKVAFSDVILCFELLSKGLRNIYVAEPLLLHFESKSRGYDDTPAKKELFRDEAMRTWLKYPTWMRDDPYYSPNLSLKKPYELSFAPRRRAAWSKPMNRPPRVMLLSSTHAIGHGVPVVMALQAEALRKKGHEVYMAGPRTESDFPYPGCFRIAVEDPIEAATFAADLGVDVIVAETHPFFGIARWTGSFPPVLCYDHGEPPAEWFPDAAQRKEILAEKDMALCMATTVYAISDAIAAESRTPVQGVIPEGNTHLGKWDDGARARRTETRIANGWGNDCFVVLNVCRFHSGERIYKGVNTYAEVHEAAANGQSDKASKNIVFVLCGKGTPKDVEEMQKLGLVVFANVTNDEMLNLYCAADAYTNFSRWEGFNLGVAQALAMGLPTIASDIPAHRAFGIQVTDDVEAAADWLKQKVLHPVERTPRLLDWEDPLARFVSLVESLAVPQVSPPTWSAS